MAIFGGIDVYSRAIVYLSCQINNRADTALCEFQGTVEKFGLPSRVRTHKGVEDVDIARYMLSHPARGEGRGSHITGKSVHNQRIERLWRDVFYACLFKYYWPFKHMEDTGILDVNILYFVFTLCLFHELDNTFHILLVGGTTMAYRQKAEKPHYKCG